jgi:hypothetical protein
MGKKMMTFGRLLQVEIKIIAQNPKPENLDFASVPSLARLSDVSLQETFDFIYLRRFMTAMADATKGQFSLPARSAVIILGELIEVAENQWGAFVSWIDQKIQTSPLKS